MPNTTLVFPIVLILTFIFAFVFTMFFLMTRSRRIMLRICFALFLFSVGVGIIVYTTSHITSYSDTTDIFSAVLRGIFSTSRMFFINDDYSVIAGTYGGIMGNRLWQILFWLGHVSAMMVIQATLFSLFGRKLIDSLRLFIGWHNEIFIIKGYDKYAVLLGENIATHDAPHKRPDTKRLVLFLLEDENESGILREKIAHFNGIVKVLDRQSNLPYYLKKAGLEKWRCRNKKYNLILTQDDVSAAKDTYQVVEYANQRNIKPGNLEIYVLTSSEWNRGKIESITSQKENGRRKYPYTIHIINETDLLIRQMINQHPPYKCPGLGFADKGMAGRDFSVMILGFGAVGQAALLRLIMNGQFVGSHMRATIIDRDMDNLKEHFLHCYPAIEQCCEITSDLKCFDVRGEEFYTLLNKTLPVDYIVVALGDDEISKQVALDIRLHYQRKGITHAPFIAVYEKHGILTDESQDDALFTFGCKEAIYKDAVIIRADSDRLAMAVNDTYSNGRSTWHEIEWFHQESSRAAADFIPAMLKLAGQEGMPIDDIAKKDTLTTDDELAEVLSQTEHMRWNAFHAAMGYRPISIDEMRQRFSKTGNLDFSRRDVKAKVHVTLVPWDELDTVSEAYRKLAQQTDNAQAKEMDFKDLDRKIVDNIPKFLGRRF